MADRNILAPELLRQLIRYDPDTGTLFWLKRDRKFFPSERGCNVWNSLWPGKPALNHISVYGYRVGAVMGVKLLAHRAALMIYHGRPISDHIDHINGIRHDNRLCNLREVTRQINNRNARLYSSNTSGVAGVMWEESHKAWSAKINFDGKQRRIGRFKNKEDAIAARREAEAQHGYTARHGRPAQ
jgi:hypothetical protein